MSEKKLTAIEGIKIASDGLRGTIQESLLDEITGAIREDDKALIKFHGMYEQDDRDRREERAAKKLDRLYTFMIRLRLPGGFITPEKWIACHHVANANTTGVIKITTRETIQLHGLFKSKIKPTIQAFNEANLDSIATCGDINRNVTCASNAALSKVHEEVFAYADKISTLLMPKTKAYYQIWIDNEMIVDKKEEEDPLYQKHYLPRKFKIGIAIPPNNDSDVFTNDIGLVAIVEDNKLKGFNIAIGGGLSTTHGNAETYARLATVIGFTDTEEKTLRAVYEVLTVQRDYGNRTDRKLARLKYTVDKMGVDKFKEEVEKRVGFKLEPARPYEFTERKDIYGWQQSEAGKWYYTVFVENGRVLDDEKVALKTALFEVAKLGKSNFMFTATQNVIISDVLDKDKEAVNEVLAKFKILEHTEGASLVRKNAIACVALPTCPLALAEGQRYLPTLLSKIEPLLDKHAISDQDMIVRMTGCPNGCGRPYAAEIGFVGTHPGKYNMHLGGDNQGQRLNIKYKESLNEAEILTELDSLFGTYKAERNKGETFGDFAMRKQLVK
ncbi:NADPH-dependent assimilatory sulfite reductase hemoprotein subunit [Ferruginibacter lapsinanis]|uniref:NADPH-dependent assimilatory sulfite reductase hemoprotein subunit n=1 Tax=Ferruginibacter lapsinanis TaxID=563172 RepID=UPI001E320682|nr:NADPH-dependent assimilatory sulfite reductase hemoprotein subunit [Ferruginibacter lapsinanis]UEG48995.1 NADPH-dependent assimilatory sulfite reductase hemoprotein subunit [Ferruginibacter lapsinanis]